MANFMCHLAWPWDAQIKRFGCVYEEIRFWVGGLPNVDCPPHEHHPITEDLNRTKSGGRRNVSLFLASLCELDISSSLTLGLRFIPLPPWFSVLWTWNELYCQLPRISSLQIWVFLSQNLLWGIHSSDYGGWQDPISVRRYLSILFLLFLWRTWLIE